MIRRFPLAIAATILALSLTASASMAGDEQLGQVAEQLRTALAGDPVEVTQKAGSVTLTSSADTMFPSGGWQVPSTVPVLDKMLPTLSKLENAKIVVGGYTDNEPIGEGLKTNGVSSNLDLSAERAVSIANYLTSHGVKPDLISAHGFGETDPVASNDTPEGRAKNRRVDITLTGGGTCYVNPEAFHRIVGGSQVDLYTLKNSNGLEAKITNYGGILVSLLVPDKNGKLTDVVLGYDDLCDYLAYTPYFGAIVGRYGNRIGKAKFTLGGVDYHLVANNDENSLHGGRQGFDKVVWKAERLNTGDGPALKLTYTSKDWEEGFPGNLSCTVTYTLTNKNCLKIEYAAETDKPTVVNLTHHSYFNLKDAGASDILGHELMIKASKFTPVDQGLIPTGELRAVAGTPFDFNKPTAIGARVGNDDEQLKFGRGYDHNWVLDRQGKDLELVASVYEPTTGILMEVLTTEPGLQFYCGNFLDGTNKGKCGIVYQHRTGFCLETQHFPDSPNHPNFPSTELKPGEKYTSTTVYCFSTK